MLKSEQVSSSSFEKNDGEYEQMVEFSETKAAVIRAELREFRLEGEEAKAWEKPVRDIKKDLIGWYEQAGLELGYEDFPELILIPEDNVPEAAKVLYPDGHSREDDETFNRNLAMFRQLANVSVVAVPKDPALKIFVMQNIYHELTHSVGRKVTAIVETDTKVVNKSAVLGFKTGGKSARGGALEELVPVVLSENYSAVADEPSIASARDEYFAEVGLSDLSPEQKASIIHGRTEQQRLEFPGYNQIKFIFHSLASKAEKHGISAHEFISRFVRARVNTKERQGLHNLLVDLMGKEDARALAKASIEDTYELGAILEHLEKDTDETA